jgi:acetolactate synthase regulatory subunit
VLIGGERANLARHRGFQVVAMSTRSLDAINAAIVALSLLSRLRSAR